MTCFPSSNDRLYLAFLQTDILFASDQRWGGLRLREEALNAANGQPAHTRLICGRVVCVYYMNTGRNGGKDGRNRRKLQLKKDWNHLSSAHSTTLIWMCLSGEMLLDNVFCLWSPHKDGKIMSVCMSVRTKAKSKDRRGGSVPLPLLLLTHPEIQREINYFISTDHQPLIGFSMLSISFWGSTRVCVCVYVGGYHTHTEITALKAQMTNILWWKGGMNAFQIACIYTDSNNRESVLHVFVFLWARSTFMIFFQKWLK